MTANENFVQEQTNNLINRLKISNEESKDNLNETDDINQIILTIAEEFPGDVGIMCPLFMNVLRLSPGQAFFIPPNEPHAYLKGDILECMSLSDNVIRAALTPKFKDVQTLCSMLTYRAGPPEILNGNQINDCVKRYTPPIPEFEIEIIDLAPIQAYTVGASSQGSFIIVLHGNGELIAQPSHISNQNDLIDNKLFSFGSVFYIEPGNEIIIQNTNTTSDVKIARAHINESI